MKFAKTFDDLLEDKRSPHPVRHLRKVYRDPMMGNSQWGLIEAPGGGIRGVHSLSLGRPMKTANFEQVYRGFAEATSYADWKFVFAGDQPEARRRLGVNLPPPSAQSSAQGRVKTAPSVDRAMDDPPRSSYIVEALSSIHTTAFVSGRIMRNSKREPCCALNRRQAFDTAPPRRCAPHSPAARRPGPRWCARSSAPGDSRARTA